jgi:hypothetical protein
MGTRLKVASTVRGGAVGKVAAMLTRWPPTLQRVGEITALLMYFLRFSWLGACCDLPETRPPPQHRVRALGPCEGQDKVAGRRKFRATLWHFKINPPDVLLIDASSRT